MPEDYKEFLGISNGFGTGDKGFVGSKEAFEKMEWCCVKWSAGGAADMSGHAGFRRYIEDLVEDSMEENWESNCREQGIDG